MKKISKKVWKEYILIVIGTLMLAIGINVFFDPLGMVIGGVTGLAIVIKELTEPWILGGIPLWITNLVINIPLFVLAVLLKGRNFGRKSLLATIFLSFFLYITADAPELASDVFLGSVFGGVISGIGLGFVFSAMATTGGTDLAASLLQRFFKHVSVAQIMMVLDSLIIASGFLIFGAEKSMYAIIAVFITAKLIDYMLEGLHFSKAAFIISDHQENIAKSLIEDLDRGVTGLNGEGVYTKAAKKVLLCVVSKKEIVKLKAIVKKHDPNAFVIVADVREVLGEGFIEYET